MADGAPDRRGRSRGQRGLGAEDRRLWERVASTVSPLQPREQSAPPLIPAPLAESAPRGDALSPSLPSPIRSRLPRRTRLDLAPAESRPVGKIEAGLDRRTAERLRKGSRQPDSRLDLHGMTAERAHGVCLRFLGEALGRGDRVVLVITGKGRARDDGSMRYGGSMHDGRGILRESLPGWLRSSPLGHSIVGIYRAHRKHGGDGAFYVYLKKRR